MDAGIAAVVGAAIGGGLAGLTAVGTGLFGLRQARLQLKHQESEATRQRRFDSLTERRGPRSQAYADFVAAGQELVDALYLREPDFLAQFQELQTKIRKQRSTVAIAGPDEVVHAAGEFANALRGMRNNLVHDRQASLVDYRRPFERLLDDFTRAARAALEDEGHTT